jgi:hypothetical protein
MTRNAQTPSPGMDLSENGDLALFVIIRGVSPKSLKTTVLEWISAI